jgi:hypothetical protein
MGRLAKCVHSGRSGRITSVDWRGRTATGGDWGVFLTLTDERGAFTCRPAFVEYLEEESCVVHSAEVRLIQRRAVNMAYER